MPYRHRPETRRLESLDDLWWQCENSLNGMDSRVTLQRMQKLLEILSSSYPEGQIDGLDEWLDPPELRRTN